MVQVVIGALIIGILAIFAMVIGQGVIEGQDTSGWPPVLSTIGSNITPIIGIVAIVSMFALVIRAAGGMGGGGI